MGISTPLPETGPSTSGHGRLITPGLGFGFSLIVSLFFIWAIANNFNDILIRQFQKALDLNRAQAGFIQFVFYIGYFTVALPAGLLMRRYGYKAGVLVGLALYAAGAALFYPASIAQSYTPFLLALFILASGAACLETAANPYVTAFGDPSRATQRLNLAQAFNGLGALIAPAIGGLFIFSGVEHSKEALAAMSPAELAAYRTSEAHTVQMPYLVLAGFVILVAIAIWLTRLPEVRVAQQPPLKAQFRKISGSTALRGAVIAQFFYVGAQVGIWSYFVDFVKDTAPHLSERTAAYLLSASLAMFMVGRFAGTAMMQRVQPVMLLAAYCLINVGLCAAAVFAPGQAAIGALMLTGFFMSIMFPTIFALGVQGLGDAAPLGSSLIIMAIIGGALFPPLMGWVSHATGSIQLAMLLPLVCFVFVGLYARRGAHRAAGAGG